MCSVLEKLKSECKLKMTDAISQYFEELSKIVLRMHSKTSVRDVHIELKELYKIIRRCPVKVADPGLLEVEQLNVFLSVTSFLFSVISNNNMTSDLQLLSSTCLILLVTVLFTPEFASSFFIWSYSFVDEKKTGEESKYKDEKEIQEAVKNVLLNSSLHLTVTEYQYFSGFEPCAAREKIPVFPQIALLHGILSCQTLEVFSIKLKSLQQLPFLIVLFKSIYLCCINPGGTQFHAFSALLNWMKICEKCLVNNALVFQESRNKSQVFFSSKTLLVEQILSLLESNWESPIKGITGFVKDIYKSLISVSKTESKILKTKKFNIIQFLLDKVMTLSWKVKGKYLVLSVILQYIDYFQFLEKYPDAPSVIIQNLQTNYVSSIIGEVYKTVVANMINMNENDVMTTEFCKWWRKPIIDSICSRDKLLSQNVRNIILPWTVKNVPNAYELLLEEVDNRHSIAPKFTLLRIAKEIGVCHLKEKELNFICKYLHHQDIQLRMEILSILCSSPKKSECVKPKELELLKDFINENLNVDSALFQQQLLSQLRMLLVRIRDSCVQEYHLKSKNTEFSLCVSQLEFVEWLAQTAIKNTFPGACYQRRRLSLQILGILYDVFIVSPLGIKRKEKPSKNVNLVIEWAQNHEFWHFFKNNLLLNIIPCLTDYTDEIRALAAGLLLEYSIWSTISDQNIYFSSKYLLNYAHTLCNHPDYRNNDGGAHLYSILFVKIFVNEKKLTSAEYCLPLNFLKDLIKTANCQLNSAKIDLLMAASHYPVHGILLALQYCLANSKDFLLNLSQTNPDETVQLLQSIFCLCAETMQYMLNVMKGNDEKENCPSFLDIGHALEKVILAKCATLHEDDSALTETEDNHCMYDNYSSEFELILSCCWHSIKNSCFLLCEFSSCISPLNLDYDLKKHFIQEIASMLSSVLITCRHRGVVDACSLALAKFCACLTKNEPLHEEICKHLLDLVFNSLSDASSTSVTRRSAGFPLLFQAVVSSEENNINRKLLSYAVYKIVDLIYQPLPPSDSINEKTDLPQVHAYHILKALVMDSSLSQAILTHLDCIIPACVSGFSSSLWAVRNGALQLFGVLLPRMCGQKKVRDEDSEHNLVSASELFSRCPALKAYLLQQLKMCVSLHKKKKLCSELMPILSLIVKLSPQQDEMKSAVTDFKSLLIDLFDIPVWKVRDLVSSALSQFMDLYDVFHQIDEMKYMLKCDTLNSNKLHSMLLLVQKLIKKNCKKLSKFPMIVPNLKELYHLMQKRMVSAFLLGIITEVFLMTTELKEERFSGDILEFQSQHSFTVGKTFYEMKLVSANLKFLHTCDIHQFIKLLSAKDTAVQSVCLQFFFSKLKSEKHISSSCIENNMTFWKKICLSTLDFIRPERHPSIIKETLQFIIELCSDWSIGSKILDPKTCGFLIEHLKNLLDMQSGLTVAALSFTVLSLCIKSSLQHPTERICLEKWNLLFGSYSQPRSADILRMQAAFSISFLGSSLVEYLTVEVDRGSDFASLFLLGVFESSLLLLQDEDEEIRNTACKFPSSLTDEYDINILQFNIGIKVLCQFMCKTLKSQPNFLLYLWNRLQNYPSSAKVLKSCDKIVKMNLFEQEYVNVFAEPICLLLLHKENFMCTLSELHEKDVNLWQDQLRLFICDVISELLDVQSVLSSIDEEKLNQGFTYHHQVFLALKKLYCQVKVLESQICFLIGDDVLISSVKDMVDKWLCIERRLPAIICWFIHKL